jgi:hypothetical protein
VTETERFSWRMSGLTVERVSKQLFLLIVMWAGKMAAHPSAIQRRYSLVASAILHGADIFVSFPSPWAGEKTEETISRGNSLP